MNAVIPKRHKYGAKSTDVDGIRFSSRKEAGRWQELKMLERGGEITGLTRQVTYYLQGANGPILTPTGWKARYVADFVYFDNRTKDIVVEDAKGYATAEYKLKRAILAAQGITIVEV